MYRLFFDELTGTFFVGNDVTIEKNLTQLTNKLFCPDGYFTCNEYCTALGIDKEDPFNSYRFERGAFDLPYVFDEYLAVRNGAPAMCIGICVNG